MTEQEYIDDPALAIQTIRTSHDSNEVAKALASFAVPGAAFSDPADALQALRTSFVPQDITNALFTLQGAPRAVEPTDLQVLRTSHSTSEVGVVLASLVSTIAPPPPPPPDYSFIREGSTIIGYTGTLPAELVIPATVDGVAITTIGANAFQYNFGLTSVTISEGITSLEYRAFAFCYFSSVTLPSSLTSIGVTAFIGCSSLTSITIPANVADISDYAFDSCSSLTVAHFLGNAPSFGIGVFSAGDGFTIRYDPTKTGWSTPTWNGYPCTPLLPYAFTVSGSTITGVTGIIPANIVIPATVDGVAITAVGNYLFYGNTSLLSVTISEGITSVGDFVFFGCSNLASVVFPNSLTSIGFRTFDGCGALSGIVFPDGLTSIGASAFFACGSLTTLTIPASVTSLSDYAFYACSGLTRVTFLGNAPSTLGNLIFQLNGHIVNPNLTIYYDPVKTGFTTPTWVGHPCLPLYAFTVSGSTITGFTGTLPANLVIPASVNGTVITAIGVDAFRIQRGITSVTISEGITTLGEAAFLGCNALSSVTLPSSLVVLGQSALLNCNLTTVTIPTNVTTIGGWALQGNVNLTSANFLGNAPSLGPYVFASTGAGFAVRYDTTKTGWSTPTWNGYPCMPIDNWLGLTIPLPAGVTLQLDLPMDSASDNPPPDLSGRGHNPSLVGNAAIQTSIKRAGKSYAGFAPAALDGISHGRWTWSTAVWNSLVGKNFALEAWVYMPAGAVYTGGYAGQVQTFCGGGGPSSGEPAFGLVLAGGVPKLHAEDGLGLISLTAPDAFPLNQWVHVAVTHVYSPAQTVLYINRVAVATNNGGTFGRAGGWYSFNIGSREFNHIWASGWGGYISNFKLFS